MKITLIKPDVIYKDKLQNIKNLEILFSQAGEVGSLIILPELFSTGYIFENKEVIHALCEDFSDSPTIQALQRIALQYQSTIVAVIAQKEGGQFFNSVVVVDGSGLQYTYQKISQTLLGYKRAVNSTFSEVTRY